MGSKGLFVGEIEPKVHTAHVEARARWIYKYYPILNNGSCHD